MVRLLVMTLCVWSWLTLLPSLAAASQENVGSPTETLPEEPSVSAIPDSVAEIPYEEALEIFERNREILMQFPGVQTVELRRPEGIIVRTDNPSVIPPEVGGLPIKTFPRIPEPQKQIDLPPGQQCPPDTQWNAEWGRCVRNSPFTIPSLELLPPPPGVIILRPGKVREQADSCPEGFEEARGENDWRFCIDPQHPEPIPPLMVPPIAGIPYEEALAILERHRAELMQLPGVEAVGMGVEGIVVETENPAVLPLDVEGLPIKPTPPIRATRGANHAVDNPIVRRSRVDARGFFCAVR